MTTGILNQITTSWMHHPNRTGKSKLKKLEATTLQEREAMLQAASIQDNTPYQLVF